MATKGSHITTWYFGINKIEFVWERTSFSVSENKSTIYWRLNFVTGTAGAATSVNDRDWRVNINGKNFFGGINLGTVGSNKSVLIAEGTLDIPHNADGSKTFAFNYYFELDFVLSVEKEARGSGTAELDPIQLSATILNAPNFNDEENPTITYSNPAGESATLLQACISLTGANDDVAYRDIPKTGSSYTFELTEAERKVLRAGTPENNRVVRFYVKSTVNGITYFSNLDKAFTVINSAPTFSPIVVDTNERTVTLTGNNKKLVKGFSIVSFVTGLAAQKESTIVDTSIINGAQTMRLDGPIYNGTFEKVTSNTFYFSATDSRGNVAKDFVTAELIPYVPLTCFLEINSFSANGALTFTIQGQYFNGSFGANPNTMELEYALSENGGDITWVRAGFITPTMIDTNRYSYTYTISNLNYLSNYELTVNVIDELTPVQSVSTVIAPSPIFDWGNEDFKFNVPVYANKGIVVPNTYTGMTPNDVGGGVYYVNSNGEYSDLISVMGNDISIGAENGINGVGSVRIEGDAYINNCLMATNKVLWQGASHMNGNQTAYLSEAITRQANGIVLVFSYYDYNNSEPADHSWSTHFIPKQMMQFNVDGRGHTFLMGINAGFSSIGAKYLFIYNTYIQGHSGNTSSGNNSGITFNNSNYVLRYVIGV
jgi:hypothetical protein